MIPFFESWVGSSDRSPAYAFVPFFHNFFWISELFSVLLGYSNVVDDENIDKTQLSLSDHLKWLLMVIYLTHLCCLSFRFILVWMVWLPWSSNVLQLPLFDFLFALKWIVVCLELASIPLRSNSLMVHVRLYSPKRGKFRGWRQVLTFAKLKFLRATKAWAISSLIFTVCIVIDSY